MSKSDKKFWVWCLTSMDTVFYRIFDSRAKTAAHNLLSGYGGTVVADGYGAYEALARAGPGFTLVNCWAHVRRKFVEAEPHYPQQAREILDLIGKLYGVERDLPSLVGVEDPVEATRRLAVRAELRHERSRPLVEEIRPVGSSAYRQIPSFSMGRGSWKEEQEPVRFDPSRESRQSRSFVRPTSKL